VRIFTGSAAQNDDSSSRSVKYLMQKLDWSFSKCAKRIGCSTSNILWEKHKVCMSVDTRYCQLLTCWPFLSINKNWGIILF